MVLISYLSQKGGKIAQTTFKKSSAKKKGNWKEIQPFVTQIGFWRKQSISNTTTSGTAEIIPGNRGINASTCKNTLLKVLKDFQAKSSKLEELSEKDLTVREGNTLSNERHH